MFPAHDICEQKPSVVHSYFIFQKTRLQTNGPICPSNASSTVAVPAASLASGDGASEIIVFIEYIRQVLTHLNQDEALGRLDRLTDFPKVFGLRLNHSNFCLQCSFCILVVD